MLLVSLLGLSLTAGALFIVRSPLAYFAAILVAGVLFAVGASMLSR